MLLSFTTVLFYTFNSIFLPHKIVAQTLHEKSRKALKMAAVNSDLSSGQSLLCSVEVTPKVEVQVTGKGMEQSAQAELSALTTVKYIKSH